MIRLNESPSFLEHCIQSKIVYPLSLEENSFHIQMAQETSPAVATGSLASPLGRLLQPLCVMPEPIMLVLGLGVSCAGSSTDASEKEPLPQRTLTSKEQEAN